MASPSACHSIACCPRWVNGQRRCREAIRDTMLAHVAGTKALIVVRVASETEDLRYTI